MQRVSASIAIVLLVVAAPIARGQTVNDTPDSSSQTRTTVPAQRETPDGQHGLLDEPSFITKGVNLFERRANSSHGPKDGFYVELGNMITGAGWISAGPGYRKLLLNENAIVSASGALSVRFYRMAQASIEFPHLAADHVRFGAQTLFRDALQVNYFGLGNNTLETNRSGYWLQTNDVTTYAGVSAGALSVQARVGWLQPVNVSSMGRDAVYPDTVAVFTEQDTPGLTNQPSYSTAIYPLASIRATRSATRRWVASIRRRGRSSPIRRLGGTAFSAMRRTRLTISRSVPTTGSSRSMGPRRCRARQRGTRFRFI